MISFSSLFRKNSVIVVPIYKNSFFFFASLPILLHLYRKMSSGYPPQAQKTQPGLQHEMKPEPVVVDQNYKAAGKLKGKKLFITGGDSGIGRSVVVMMAMEGVDGITIVHKPHEEKDAKDTREQAERHGAKVHLVAGDLHEREACKNAVESHISEFGTIDILINNASEQHLCAKFEEIDLDLVEKTFKSNGKFMSIDLSFSHTNLTFFFFFYCSIGHVCCYKIRS